MIREIVPNVRFFDSDVVVGDLLREKRVLCCLQEAFGGRVVDRETGLVDRKYLRELIFEDEESRVILENLLHPMVEDECERQLSEWFASNERTFFIADVPLLFEKGFGFGQEMNLVVATSPETQRLRLRKRDGFDDEMISSILASQLPIGEKVSLGDLIFWNEGSETLLRQQVARFFKQR